MSTTPPDPYTVLGVPRNATTAEITRAYRILLRRYHPDTRTADQLSSGDPDAMLRQVLAAHDLLRDPSRRAAYDRLHPATRRSNKPVARATDRPPIQAGPVYWWPR